MTNPQISVSNFKKHEKQEDRNCFCAYFFLIKVIKFMHFLLSLSCLHQLIVWNQCWRHIFLNSLRTKTFCHVCVIMYSILSSMSRRGELWELRSHIFPKNCVQSTDFWPSHLDPHKHLKPPPLLPKMIVDTLVVLCTVWNILCLLP